jgi:hypothetical protein
LLRNVHVGDFQMEFLSSDAFAEFSTQIGSTRKKAHFKYAKNHLKYTCFMCFLLGEFPSF